MKVLLLGPPGSGKGTYATRLSKKRNAPHISTGDIFRRLKEQGGELAEKVAGYMTAGELVPDEIVNRVVAERLAEADCQENFLLDGYPRNLEQARLFDELLKEKGWSLDAAFQINVSEETLRKRISGRRTCRDCGAIFNVFTLQPKTENVCDQCSGELYQRADDKEEAVANRLKVYERETAPLIDYYRESGALRAIDGEGGIDEALAAIEKILDGGA
jgi:adenylate kinase